MKKKNGSPVNFTFDDFAGLCVSGITAKRCHDTHWQLVGGRRVVNLWPTTGKMMLDSGESGKARTIDDVEAFIGRQNIYQSNPSTNGEHKTSSAAGIQYGIAVLQIEYWTAVRDDRTDDAIKTLQAIEALQIAKL